MADAIRNPAADVFGKRYGEVLLVHVGESGPEATVYNTFPLNDCPDELWSKLDAKDIAAENNAAAALLNGPRYWLMSSIEMIKQATVGLSSMNPTPYSVNEVDRKAVFPQRVDTSTRKAHVTQDDFANSYSLQSL